MGRTEHPECDRCSLDCCRARDAVCLILGSISTVAAGTSIATCTVGQGFGPRQGARQSPSGMMNLSIRRSTLDLLERQTLCQALDARGAGRVVPDQGRRWPHPRLRLFRGRADAPELLQALVQGRRPSMTVRLIGHEESFEVRYTSANEPTFVDNAAKLIRCDLFLPARRPWPLRGPAGYRAGLTRDDSRGCPPNKNICSGGRLRIAP